MAEETLSRSIEDATTLKNQLTDLQQYIREVKIYHCFDALILTWLVAVFLQTFTYLSSGPIQTDFQKTLYMFCLLIGPSVFLLTVLHLYDLYGFTKRGEKSIPLTLDITYFLFIGFACITMFGLTWYYQQHQISSSFLSAGWIFGVSLICGEVFLSLMCARFLIRRFVSKQLPHFFTHSQTHYRKKQRVHKQYNYKSNLRPNQVYYFRKKPDVSLWENEDYFIKYKQP